MFSGSSWSRRCFFSFLLLFDLFFLVKKLYMAKVSKGLGAFFCLPREIVVEILSKTNLKTLGICKRVSRRFYQIACQVDTISFNAPSRWKTNNRKIRDHVCMFAVLKRGDENCRSTRSAKRFYNLVYGLIDSVTKFTRIRSLYIQLPLSSVNGLPFLKWKVSIASNRIDSFVFLSPTSIHNTKGSSYVNGNDDHENEEPYLRRNCFHNDIAWKCMEDAFVRYMMLFGFARECPFLEKISITDRCKRGRISLSGAKLSEVRKSSTAPPKVDGFRHKVSWCRIPLLDLPGSGFVMKGVELILYEDVHHLPYGYRRYDRYISNIDDEDDFEGKEKAAYSEAVREIFKNHREKISHW